MNKKVKIVLGTVLGIAAGMGTMMGCHAATTLVYPPPEGLSFSDPDDLEALQEWMGTLPTGAFLLAALCHWIGTGAGAVVGMFLSGRRSLVPALVVGGFFLVGGIANFIQISHPAWFPYLDIPGYFVFALGAGKLLVKPPTD